MRKGKALTGGARLAAAKPPRAVPGLAARCGTAVAPRHKAVSPTELPEAAPLSEACRRVDLKRLAARRLCPRLSRC
jgi:hypothetical protein